MKNPRKQQMNRIPVLILLAALGFCSAQDGMPNDTMLNDGEDIQAESSEQRFLREPLDQIAAIGEHVTLPCRVVNKLGTLQWTRDDFGLGTDRNLTGFKRYKMTGSDEEENGPSFVSHFRDVFPFINNSLVPNEDIHFFEFVEGNYTGQVIGDGIRHGWGEMLWSNGTLYGLDNEFYYTLGDKYFGQWENGYQEGLGTFYSQTGVYVGDWSCGLQNGKAHVFLNNGNKYEGYFKNGFMHGNGTFSIEENGDSYTGDFLNGMRHGKGIETYGVSHERYVGSYENDTRHGQGTAYYADGSIKYIGSWKNGNPDGNGTYFMPQQGLKFVGEFSEGRPTGQGLIYDANGGVVGPWQAETLSSIENSSGLGSLLNLGNNKYTNLLKMIGNYVNDLIG